MRIHCLYRDFFLFLKAMEIEENRWHSFKEYYFNKYKDFLSQVWFKLQGYTQKNIKERVALIKRNDYSDLEAELKVYDIERNTRRIIDDCREVLYYPEICNIYLFIGFFSPDAFVFKFKQHFVIAIGLERFHNFNIYPLLLAHEYCHYIQNMLIGESGSETNYGIINDRIIREGLCIYFSTIVYPNKKPWEYLFMKKDSYYQLEDRYQHFIDILKTNGFEGKDIFHGIVDNGNNTYPRLGYFLGYKIVSKFINKVKGENDNFIDLIKNKDKILELFWD